MTTHVGMLGAYECDGVCGCSCMLKPCPKRTAQHGTYGHGQTNTLHARKVTATLGKKNFPSVADWGIGSDSSAQPLGGPVVASMC